MADIFLIFAVAVTEKLQIFAVDIADRFSNFMLLLNAVKCHVSVVAEAERLFLVFNVA